MQKILIIILFLISFVCTSVNAKQITFAQFSDTHVSLTEKGTVDAKVEHMKQAIKEINHNRDIKFVLFTGDCIHRADKATFKAYLGLINKLHKPYYILVGNHDVFRYKDFDKKDFMHAVWLHHPQMLFKGTNYVFKPNRDIVFIVVDGANELMPSPSGYFKPETLEWLDKQLKKYQHKKVVLVQHFPIIPPKKHKSHDTINAEEYFHVINSYDNVIAVVSGHFHYNNVIYKKGIYHLSAPAFAEPDYEYKIITIDYDPKYLYSDPSEFEITQKLMPMAKENK